MKKSIGAVLLFGLLLSSCGTIKHGTSQDLTIHSNPPGALVVVDGVDVGQTPLSVNLKRKNTHTVSVRMNGYERFQTSIARKLSGWSVLGGPVGWLIDDATGGMYLLSPGELNVELVPIPVE